MTTGGSAVPFSATPPPPAAAALAHERQDRLGNPAAEVVTDGGDGPMAAGRFVAPVGATELPPRRVLPLAPQDRFIESTERPPGGGGCRNAIPLGDRRGQGDAGRGREAC